MKQLKTGDQNLDRVQQNIADEFKAQESTQSHVRIRTANASAILTTEDRVVVMIPAGADLTTTLPSAQISMGIVFYVKHGGSANNVVVSAIGMIDGSSVTLTAGQALRAVSDGTGYWSV
jgi:hypothetical protein